MVTKAKAKTAAARPKVDKLPPKMMGKTGVIARAGMTGKPPKPVSRPAGGKKGGTTGGKKGC